MQSNVHSLFVDNDFPDSWVELYNPTGADIDISGWKIGPEESPLTAYTLPEALTVKAGGYVVVCCDKVGKGLHSNFRLESTDPGQVCLFDREGNTVDRVAYGKMPAPDVAFGRVGDGALDWGWFVTATPGAKNTGSTASTVLPDPYFSLRGGVFSAPVTLTVSIPAGAGSNTALCVTTDGRVPETSDAVESPFEIEISESTPVRAVLRADGQLSPLPLTRTFLFPDHEIEMPVVCLTTDDSFLYDKETGMLSSAGNPSGANYMNTWRRPVNIEVFDGKGHPMVINQIGETAISGHSSRKWAQNSLKLYANKRFGAKKFKHALWPDDKPGIDAVKSFTLRNSGNVFNVDHLRDAYWNRLFGPNTDGRVDFQAYRPCVAFINGKPYGMIDMRERSNDDFVEANYPDVDDFCLVEDWWDIKCGDWNEFLSFKALYDNPAATYGQLDAIMDMESFATSLIADSFSFNVDTPAGNKAMWKAKGGKWKWLLKDMDCTNYMKLVDDDYIDYINHVPNDDFEDWFNNREDRIGLYRRCLGFPEFTSRMVDLFIAYNGDFLHPDVTCALFDEMAEEIAEEFEYTAEQYGFWYGLPYYVADLKEYMVKRGDYMLSQFRDRYSLGEIVPLTIFNANKVVSLNGHRLSREEFRGSAFSSRELRLESDGSGLWTVYTYDDDNKCTTRKYYDANINLTLGESIKRCIVAYRSLSDGIDSPELVDSDNPAPVYYDMNGIRLDGRPETRGIYLRREGTKCTKIKI